jgi:coenzyme PQQ precursor peptide PqqA
VVDLSGYALLGAGQSLEAVMIWSKPEFIELRFGFEVTMYVWNR